MNEKTFIAEIKKSLEKSGFYTYKIPDLSTSQKNNEVKQMRFEVTRTCDIFASIYGRFVAIKTIFLQRFKTFGIKNMRGSQIRNLNLLEKYDVTTFVFLAFKQKLFGQKNNRFIFYTWDEFKDREVWLKEYLMKRLEKQYCEAENGIFDLEPFIDHNDFLFFDRGSCFDEFD